MATRLENLSHLFSDVKTRTMILFTGVVLILGVIIAVIGIRKNATQSDLPTSASTVNAPRIGSLPGLKSPSAQYSEIQQQVNVAQAQRAQQTGGSAIPTLIGEIKEDDKDVPLVREQSSANPQVLALQQQLEQQQRLMAEQRAHMRRQANQKHHTARLQQQQQLEQAMATQARALFSAWSQVPKHKYVAGAPLPKPETASKGREGSDRTRAVRSVTPGFEPIHVKAGDILFAVLSTGINSDEPGPVLATIVSSGRLHGAKLMGTIKRVEKRVMVQFTVLSLPTLRNSIAIKAFAIDPDTARTALATSVNSHYLMRYGSLFASAFLEGYAKAVEIGDSKIVTNNSTGEVVAQETKALSPRERVLMGFGQVGTKLSENLNVFNKPPTVRVASGTGLGLLFLGDLEITGEVLLPAGVPTSIAAGTLTVPAFAPKPVAVPKQDEADKETEKTSAK